MLHSTGKGGERAAVERGGGGGGEEPPLHTHSRGQQLYRVVQGEGGDGGGFWGAGPGAAARDDAPDD